MDKPKRMTGRPQLKGAKRTKFVNVRFTEDEFKLVGNLEQALGISRTELIRIKILSDANKTIVNAKDLIANLDKIGAEMGRAGNNINQLARHANTLQLKKMLSPFIVEQFNRLFDEYIQVLRSVEAALRKIIRATGN